VQIEAPIDGSPLHSSLFCEALFSFLDTPKIASALLPAAGIDFIGIDFHLSSGLCSVPL